MPIPPWAERGYRALPPGHGLHDSAHAPRSPQPPHTPDTTLGTRFTARDIGQLAKLSKLLLAPIGSVPEEEWRARVLRTARELLSANGSVLQLPGPGGGSYYADGIDPAIVHAYRDHYKALDEGWWVRRPHLGLAVARLDQLWSAEEIRRSPFHRDFLRPSGIGDFAGMTVMAHGQPAVLLCARFRGGEPFTDRETVLLRAALPAFRTAVRARSGSPGNPHPAEALRRRYGLTRREAETALLLDEGRSNREIAASLAVSQHTARHHVEAVLTKLGVQRRSAVSFRIREVGSAGGLLDVRR